MGKLNSLAIGLISPDVVVFVVELALLGPTRGVPLGGVMLRHSSTPNRGGGKLNPAPLLKPMSVIGEAPVLDLSNNHLASQTPYYHYYIRAISI